MSRIGDMLSSSRKSAQNDCSAFARWQNGQITTEMCIREFKKNNRIRHEEIGEEEFTDWLRSIGWRRDERAEGIDL